jgi:DNA-binding PadR family transcriptional regulator
MGNILGYYYVRRYYAGRNIISDNFSLGGKCVDLVNLGRFSDPALFILTSLADGAKHGYAMMQDIETLFGVRLGPGTLYGALARLEQHRLIEPLESADRRRPYRLTPTGAAFLRDQLANLEAVAMIGRRRLASL